MGKNRNRQRREDRRRRQLEERGLLPPQTVYENSPPVLRLVRPEDERVSAEPIAPGLPDPPVDRVRQGNGLDGAGGEEKSAPDVVATPVPGPAPEVVASPVIVRRSFDATDINPIINHPSVFPFVTIPGIDYIDVSPVLADERNILLMGDGGGILFIWCEPGVYEIHTNFLKPERGAHGKGPYIQNFCLAAYRWMFTRTDCLILLTKIPAFNRAANIFAPLLGWVKEFDRQRVWPTKEGLCDLSYWSLPYNVWMRKTPDLMQAGRKFHERLTEEFLRHGIEEEQHPHEDCHDLYVGACAETMLSGQVEKAIALYNAWARFAGYGQIDLVSHSPMLIDIGNALLQLTGHTFKVVKVK